MPIYEFECPMCGERRESLQSFEAPAPICEPCSNEKTGERAVMRRRMSASSFVLRGSGWSHDNYGLK